MKRYLTILAVLGAFTVSGCNTHCKDKDVILFASDSYALTMEDKAELDSIAKQMNKHSSKKAKVFGHADSTGTAEHNAVLSEERAKEAARYLEAKGVSADRIKIGAFGETKPFATNATSEGRQLNRRVVVKLYK